MAERGLTDRLKNSLLTGLLAGSLALGSIGCGGSSPAPTPQPPRPQPSLSQSASIVNNVDINYGATLTNVALATRTITHDGNLFGNPTTISIPQYNETLSGLEKGDYTSRLEATGATTHTLNWNIQNYAPTSNFSSLETNLNEGSQITLNFEGTFNDKNPEDNPVPLVGATPLSGGVGVVSINGYNVTIKAPEITDESIPEINYELNVDFGSSAGGLENTVLSGKVINVPDQIAFWSNRDQGTGELYSGEIVGGNLTKIKRLTNNQANDVSLAWSPDGNKIAFASNRDLKSLGIWVMDADGSNPTKITPDEISSITPTWCSNGKLLIDYVDSASGSTGIASINPDGTEFKKIIEEPFIGIRVGNPTCFPDGSEIAFETFRGGNSEVYVRETDGTERNLTNNPAVDGQPRWSPADENNPNGRIAFITDRDTLGQAGEFNQYLINPDGTGIVRLTDFIGREIDLAWFPDGTRAAFTKVPFIGADFQIYLGNVVNGKIDESKLIQLTTEGQNRYPAWRPRPNQP